MEHAAYASVNPLWDNMTGTPTATARRWFDSPAWPVPSNFCDIYECFPGVPPPFERYTSAPRALWPGLNDVAVLVTTTLASGFPSYDVAVVSSYDGGITYPKSKLISLGPSGGSSSIDPNSIDATVVVTDETSSIFDGEQSRPVYVVWRGGYPTKKWWMAKLLFDEFGDFVFLRGPEVVPNVPPGAGTVALRAYELDNGEESLDIFYTVRNDSPNQYVGLPSCPSIQKFKIEWWDIQVWDYGGPNEWWDSPRLYDTDRDWKPCVGPSFSKTGPGHYVNNDRPSVAVNQGGTTCPGCGSPWVWYFAYNRSDTHGNMRVHIIHDHQFDNYAPSVAWVAPSEPGRDDYNQNIVIHQGNETYAPMGALVRKSVLNGNVDVRVVTQKVDTYWPDSETFHGTLEWLDGGVLSGPAWGLTSYQGIGLGIAAQQLCVDERFGACGVNPAQHPGVHFYAAWPRFSEGLEEIRARKFEH